MKSKVHSGTTELKGWIQHADVANQIYIDVDTSKCEFKETPLYICSLVGCSHHWSTTGGSSIYAPTPTGFRVSVRNAVSYFIEGTCNYFPLQVSTAVKHKWRINWIAVENDEVDVDWSCPPPPAPQRPTG